MRDEEWWGCPLWACRCCTLAFLAASQRRLARPGARAKPVPGVLGAGAGGVDLKWGIQCLRHRGTRVIYPLNLWLYSMLSGFEYQLFEVSADTFHCWVRLGSSCFIIPSPDMMERHLWHDPENISRASWRSLISDYQREGISSIFSLFGMIQIYPNSQGRKKDEGLEFPQNVKALMIMCQYCDWIRLWPTFSGLKSESYE